MSTTGYEEEKLTHRDHLDPDKHWIGEALGSPSASDISVAGTATTTGDSPFAARSDHTHDLKPKYEQGNSTAVTCPGAVSPGTKTYLNTLNHLNGSNMISGGQVITPGLAGIYLVQGRVLVSRSTSTFPATTAYRFSIEYNGGTAVRPIEENNLPQLRSLFYFTFTDNAYLAANGDIQFTYTCFDAGVNNNVTISLWSVLRVSG